MEFHRFLPFIFIKMSINPKKVGVEIFFFLYTIHPCRKILLTKKGGKNEPQKFIGLDWMHSILF
jgi:hypothetical protein